MREKYSNQSNHTTIPNWQDDPTLELENITKKIQNMASGKATYNLEHIRTDLLNHLDKHGKIIDHILDETAKMEAIERQTIRRAPLRRQNSARFKSNKKKSPIEKEPVNYYLSKNPKNGAVVGFLFAVTIFVMAVATLIAVPMLPISMLYMGLLGASLGICALVSAGFAVKCYADARAEPITITTTPSPHAIPLFPSAYLSTCDATKTLEDSTLPSRKFDSRLYDLDVLESTGDNTHSSCKWKP